MQPEVTLQLTRDTTQELDNVFLGLPSHGRVIITDHESWLGRKKEELDAFFSYFMVRHAFAFRSVECHPDVIILEKR